ncbi:MAG: 50S ribosomal protein L5 [Myxococcota bacterium]|jgi:large subunit ribosomal protein L5|nr:50S ribosomal protein L5 [Myxococcota bacterium]MEC9389923.1 50S ribosomal protein L5 [Myxococcota bacterium]
MQPRLKTQYKEVVLPQLQKDFSYGNVMMVPKLEKIVVNTCLKEAITNMKILESAAAELGLITGQKAVITRARKSIANFKLRDGMPLGAKVTLRSTFMWEFLDRLIAISIPRIRDFRGLNPNGFDGRGNYSMGITEQIVFPEIDYDKVQRITGMNITFVTSANTDEEGRALLKALGMPFADK